MSPFARLSVYAIAAIGLLNALWIFYGGFEFIWSELFSPVTGVVILLAISAFYTVYRPVEDFALVTLWTAILIAFSVVAALNSYLMASLQFSFKDEYLAAFDHRLGFDWLSLLELVGRDPLIGKVATFIYSTSLPLVAFTLIYLGLTGRSKRLELFMTSLIIACFVTIALSGPMVAMGPYGHYDIPAELYQEFAPAVTTQGPGSTWLSHVMALRDGSMRVLSLSNSEGVITFPSFHTVMSVLMIFALRGYGWVSWGGGILNFAILVTVPLDGNHYLADMMAGTAVAVIVWYGLLKLQEWLARTRVTYTAPHLVPAMQFGPS